MLGLFIFVYIPCCGASTVASSTPATRSRPTDFVGLANYAYLLQDRAFLASMVTFLVFAAFIVPLTFAFSLALALMVNQMPGREGRCSGRRSSCRRRART